MHKMMMHIFFMFLQTTTTITIILPALSLSSCLSLLTALCQHACNCSFLTYGICGIHEFPYRFRLYFKPTP